ncbi:hypothetical protein [Frigoribacterium sp. PhB24]|uniref:hypothetical protein n=1 Tax=Frigoribacterium sp. PhB24 TaxID=2485204 RepID=UPI000F49EB42|nr:hypothetical protein [Frigoribacterium sp. PhB24]ROS48383.1 hypothetical protein EDF50_2877 [Frigoribacterium sp. PhB24]
MQWWNDFVEWLSSDSGWRVVTDAVIPFAAIVVAGVVAALIGRASTRRVVSSHEDEAKAAAVAALVSAARKGAVYSSLGVEERAYADHLGHEADVRLRLLPATGSTLAADWAAHQTAEIKRNSASFSFQAEQTLGELRDRLIEWQNRPNRAKKLFRDDLARWKYEEADVDRDTAAKQKAWEAEQRAASTTEQRRADGPPAASSAPSATLRPAALDESTTRRDEAYRAPTIARPVPTTGASGARAPLAGPSPVSAPEAPTVTPDASLDDTRDDPMDDERYEQPVSASQVRRRTAPERTDD